MQMLAKTKILWWNLTCILNEDKGFLKQVDTSNAFREQHHLLSTSDWQKIKIMGGAVGLSSDFDYRFKSLKLCYVNKKMRSRIIVDSLKRC